MQQDSFTMKLSNSETQCKSCNLKERSHQKNLPAFTGFDEEQSLSFTNLKQPVLASLKVVRKLVQRKVGNYNTLLNCVI